MTRFNRARRVRAILAIESCRQTHVRWIDYLRALSRKERAASAQTRHGDLRHHKKWVRNYDLVLVELRIEVT